MQHSHTFAHFALYAWRKRMHGKLIVLEGTDGSGKATHSKLLVDKLNSSGILGENRAHYWTFPNYESAWGKKIKEILTGANTAADKLDPYKMAELYAQDRGEAAAKIRELLEKGDWIVCDRYVESNMAFQASKIKDPFEKKKFLEWLEKKEYEELEIPKTDMVLFLSVPINVTIRRMSERKQTDIHEQDRQFLENVRREYLNLAREKKWKVIEVMEGNLELSIEAVKEKVWGHILGITS